MVGDGMQCPPSPLLFDPSVTLEQSLRDVPEAPIDILALEEPSHPGVPTAPAERGGSSARGFSPLTGPAAELPAQVQLGGPTIPGDVSSEGRTPRVPSGCAAGRLGVAVPHSGFRPCYTHSLDGVKSVWGGSQGLSQTGGRLCLVPPSSHAWDSVWDVAGTSHRLGSPHCVQPGFSQLEVFRGAAVSRRRAAARSLVESHLAFGTRSVSHPEPGASSGHFRRVLAVEVSSDALFCVPCHPSNAPSLQLLSCAGSQMLGWGDPTPGPH